MIRAEDSARVKRLKYWILVLTLPAGLILVVVDRTRSGIGLITGGLLILMNLFGTEQAVRAFVDGRGTGRIVAALVYVGKLAVTASVIAAALIMKIVSPLALVAGLISLPLALIFDFFIFPVNKGSS